MEKVQEALFNLLFDRMKEQLSKRFHWLVVIALAYGLYWIGTNTPDGARQILTACKATEAAVIEHKEWLSGFLFLSLVSIAIARFSNSKFKKEQEGIFPDCRTFESSDQRPLQTKIVESASEEGWRRYIQIENNLPTDIDYIKGCVVFGRGSTTTFMVPFEINIPIRSGSGYRIMNALVTDDTRSWNRFNTFIEEISAGGQTQHRLSLYGGHDRRMIINFILTRYNYLPYVPFLWRYELSWVKKVWRYKVYPWLRYSPTRPRAFEFMQPPLMDEIAFSVLPEFSVAVVSRPRYFCLESMSAIACDALSLLFYYYWCLLKATWRSRSRVAERLVIFMRRSLNRLIWLTVVGTAGWVILFSCASVVQFSWQLALVWGGVCKYGVFIALGIQ